MCFCTLSREMAYPWCRVMFVSLVAVSDIAVYLYDLYGGEEGSSAAAKQPIGHAAHLSGALTGLLVGITCLKNLRWERHERYIWAVSATVFVLLIGSAIVGSLANPSRFKVPYNVTDIYHNHCVSDKLI